MSEEKTVFVVDDDPAARESVSALAESMGLRVETYESAEEFLEELKTSRSGCLVTDVKMEGITGIELQDRLAEAGHEIPVIVITGYANVPMAVTAMQTGAVTLLEKPCNQELLARSIREALDRGETRQGEQRELEEIERRLARLTPAERDVLAMMVAGDANKVIARKLGVGLRTVEARRHQVFDKMGAESLAELVRMALLAGIGGANEPRDPPA